MAWQTDPGWLMGQFNAGMSPPLAAQLIRTGQAPKMPEYLCPSCRSTEWQWAASVYRAPGLANFYVPAILLSIFLSPCTGFFSLIVTVCLCIAWITSAANHHPVSHDQKRQCRRCNYIEQGDEARPRQAF